MYKTLPFKLSRYRGVTYKPKLHKFAAYIFVHGKLMHLGVFDDEVSAAIAYNMAAKKYFGDEAKLNKFTD